MKWGLELCPSVLERVVLTQVSAVVTEACQNPRAKKTGSL